MQTIEQLIARYDKMAKFANGNEYLKKTEAVNRQTADLLRELQERRKEPKIIRCCECEHSRDWGCELYCTKWVRYTSHNGYCHRGEERKTNE